MIYGISDGMVMQRGTDNACDITVSSDKKIRSVTTADNQTAKVTETPDGFRITGILCGGPYTLNVDGEIFNDIYVGDVWILAGQSNMQGCGRETSAERNTNPCVRALYMQGEWGIANNPLHETGRSIYAVHTEVLGAKRGFSKRFAGPGLYFAQRMYELTSVPQGLICCAHGDTSLEQWSPSRRNLGTVGSLYAAMIESFRCAGSSVKGIFWSQGCNDTNIDRYKDYTKNTAELFGQMRADMGKNLPIVYLQLSRCINDGKGGDIRPDTWNSVQEQQRTLFQRIGNADVIPTSACCLSDPYHISGKSHRILGRSAAESMFCLIYGKLYGCVGSIKLKSVEYFDDDLSPDEFSVIVVTYDNVIGSLDGGVRPLGFALTESKCYDAHNYIISCETDGNRVTITAAAGRDKIENMYLSYGMGFNPPCNIVDTNMRSLPIFEPIQLNGILNFTNGAGNYEN